MPISNNMKDTLLVAGTSNPDLSKKIADLCGFVLAEAEITVFPNKETRARIVDDISGKTVYIIQSFSDPPDRMLMEFLQFADAAQRSNAKKIIGVVPWLGYSAQDKVFRPGEPLSSDLISRLIRAAGCEEIITLDLHSPLNIEHLENAGIRVTHLSALEIFVEVFQNMEAKNDWMVLCIDKGAAERSEKFSELLALPSVTLKKSRDLSDGTVTFEDFTADLRGKNIISFDDFVSTGGSRIKASTILKSVGVKKYVDCITHGLLGNDATQKIQESAIDEMYLTDSYPIPKEKQIPKIRILSSAPVFAKEIKSRL